MEKYDEDILEAALDLCSATLEGGAPVTLDAAGAAAVTEYLAGLCKGVAGLLCAEDDEDEDEEEDEEEEEEDEEEDEADDEETADGEPACAAGPRKGKFELYADKGGRYRFRLRAANGEVIAVSEAYGSKAACRKGVESVRKNAPAAPLTEA